MVKLIYCFRRRAGMTEAEFDAYWGRVHGPIAARIPGLRRLVQSRALRVPGDARPPDFLDPASTAYLVSEERMVFEAPVA